MGHFVPSPREREKTDRRASTGDEKEKQGLTELELNKTSTLVGHFVSSPRERDKRDRRDSRGDESEGKGRKRNRNESPI